MKVPEVEILKVFEAWAKLQRRPERVRLREDRRRLIRDRIARGYEASELALLVRYAYEADTAEARFWRGENADKRSYLGLDNLFRIGKLADRVDRALDWEEALKEPDEDVVSFVGQLLRSTRRRRD